MSGADKHGCVEAKFLDPSKFWGSKCQKSGKCDSLPPWVELMAASLNGSEATKSSHLHSCPPWPHFHNPGVCAAANCQMDWSLDSSGPLWKVMASSRAE